MELEVLGRVGLGAGERLVERREPFDANVGVTRDLVLDRVREGIVVGEQQRVAVLAVLCLRQESAATWRADAVASAITTISLGPAGRSIFTRLDTSSFAAVT